MVLLMNYMDQYEDREDPRYHGFFKINLALPESGNSWETYVEDVSITGLRLSCDYPINALKVGSEVSLLVDEALNLGHVRFEGKVVHSYCHANLSLYGIKIINIEPEATYKWGKIVSQMRRKKRQG